MGQFSFSQRHIPTQNGFDLFMFISLFWRAIYANKLSHQMSWPMAYIKYRSNPILRYINVMTRVNSSNNILNYTTILTIDAFVDQSLPIRFSVMIDLIC